MENNEQFEQTIEAFDEANRGDPRTEKWDGEEYPKELLYARRMTTWLNRIEPEASEPLKLAARAQHIRRWESPRDDYPMTRKGYHRWRSELKQFHAETAGEIMRRQGYDEETIRTVQNLLQKKGLKTNPDTQTLEDVICVVFLEHYFHDFSRDYDEEKILKILRRTWGKMSPRGHKAALSLDLPDEAKNLVERALDGD